MTLNFERDKAKKTIAQVIEKIKSEPNPLLLEEYSSLFKKEVPLFNRNKVAAYLLMLCDQDKNLHFTEKRPRIYDENYHSETQRYPLSDEESKKLFFSVGRSRRVYPREILWLINIKTAIPKEDIGAIRILDNYSFVQVRDNVAEKIINALNGINFRGRPLTVNYAKSRKDDDDNYLNDELCLSEAGKDNSEEENI